MSEAETLYQVLTEPLYRRAFVRYLHGDRLTRAERRCLEARRNPDGSYPVPARLVPTLR